jgi:uncharacterized membrane protein YedE/YeeE
MWKKEVRGSSHRELANAEETCESLWQCSFEAKTAVLSSAFSGSKSGWLANKLDISRSKGRSDSPGLYPQWQASHHSLHQLFMAAVSVTTKIWSFVASILGYVFAWSWFFCLFGLFLVFFFLIVVLGRRTLWHLQRFLQCIKYHTWIHPLYHSAWSYW